MRIGMSRAPAESRALLDRVTGIDDAGRSGCAVGAQVGLDRHLGASVELALQPATESQRASKLNDGDHMRVDEAMTRPVETCKADDPLDLPARLMRDRACGCVVVVDAMRKPLAVVTDRDICMCALRTMSSLQMLRVSQAMSSQLVTCRLAASLAEAEGLMRRWRVRRLPVVDESGVLSGILSLDDIALESTSHVNAGAESVGAEEVAKTLGAIARRRGPPRAP
jgi:CBS domain-containing protein